jgi:hypothetical protein
MISRLFDDIGQKVSELELGTLGDREPVHRNDNRDEQACRVGQMLGGLEFRDGLERVEVLLPYAPDRMTIAQFPLRRILNHEAFTAAIAGASGPDPARGDAEASQFSSLTPKLNRTSGSALSIGNG